MRLLKLWFPPHKGFPYGVTRKFTFRTWHEMEDFCVVMVDLNNCKIIHISPYK